MRIWTCKNCETKNKEEDRECLVCGEERSVAEIKFISENKPEPLTPYFVSKYCNQCGKPYNKPTSNFCSYCGKKRN